MGWELDGTSLSMAFLFGVVSVVIVLAYILEHHRIRILHETGVAVLLGVMLGKVVELTAPAEEEEFVTFSSGLFFSLLLPPILLNSGYNMKRRRFFTNLGAILTYALAGTFVSFIASSVLMIGLGPSGVGVHSWSNVECFIWGSLISATDPVSTLAIMETTPVSEDLFAIVLGESVFNDAVAIVLHSTALTFVDSSLTLSSIFGAVGFFFAVFVGSVALGVAFGLAASYILKITRLRDHPHLEQGLLVSMAYAAYFVAQGLDLSGIVAILFCGITLAHYAYHSLRPSSKKITKSALKLMSYMAETVVFLFLGLALFAFRQEYNVWLLCAAAVVVLATRALHIFPFGFLINRSRASKLTKPMLSFLWFAGLRGAIAFALALDVPTPHGRSVRTVTLVLALVSILVMGGATYPVLTGLGLVHDDDGDDGDDGRDGGERGIPLDAVGGVPAHLDPAAVSSPALLRPSRALARPARAAPTSDLARSRAEAWWHAFDRNYLKPAFIRNFRRTLDGAAPPPSASPRGAAYSRSISSHSTDDDARVDADVDAFLATGAAYVPRRWGASSSGSGSATLADLPSDSGGGSSDL